MVTKMTMADDHTADFKTVFSSFAIRYLLVCQGLTMTTNAHTTPYTTAQASPSPVSAT